MKKNYQELLKGENMRYLIVANAAKILRAHEYTDDNMGIIDIVKQFKSMKNKNNMTTLVSCAP